MSFKSFTVDGLFINHYLPYPKAKTTPVSKNRQSWYIFVPDTYLERKPGKIFISNSLYEVTTLNYNLPNISLTIYINKYR